MKKSALVVALLALTVNAFAADLEYVGGNRYHCTGSNCAVLDSIQNTREPSISTEWSRGSATNEAQARRLAEIHREGQAATQKISDDFFESSGTNDAIRKIDAIKAKQAANEALNNLSVDNNAVYAKGFEDGHNAAMATFKKTKK